MAPNEEQFRKWLKLREESIDEYNENLCYCGHTFKCSCSDPSIELFNDAIQRNVLKVKDKNNGWKTDT